jgi:hypothetical protein
LLHWPKNYGMTNVHIVLLRKKIWSISKIEPNHLGGFFLSYLNIHTYCYIDSSTNTFKHKECKVTFFRSYTNNIIFIHQIKTCSSHLSLLNYLSCTTKSMPNTKSKLTKSCMHTNWNKVLQMVWFYNTKHKAPKTINGE